MEKDDLEKESQIFKDLWALRKNFYYPQTDDDYWKAAISEFGKVYQKHNSQFVSMMLMVMFSDLEARHRISQGMKNEKTETEIFDFCTKLIRSM